MTNKQGAYLFMSSFSFLFLFVVVFCFVSFSFFTFLFFLIVSMKKLELYLMVHFTALLLQDHRESISISSSDNDLRYTIAY